MNVRETYNALASKHGHDLDVATIGQAGENLVSFASIVFSVYNAAARAGGGAVMGSKKIFHSSGKRKMVR